MDTRPPAAFAPRTVGRRAPRRHLAIALIACGAALASTPGCSAGPPTAAGTTVVVSDFHIELKGRVPRAGEVHLALRNEGPTVHEVVLVRTDRAPRNLPLGPDGLSVDEEGAGVEAITEVEQVRVGEDGEALVADLEAGAYVLFCNLEGHYLGGMRTALEVRP